MWPGTTSEDGIRRVTPVAVRHAAAMLVRLGVSVGLVLLIARRVDLAAVGRAVQALGVLPLLAVLTVGFVQKAVCVQRWILIQRVLSKTFGFGRGLVVSYAALCLGQAFPSFVGGDAYRAYWLYQEGHALGPSIRGVLLDRFSAVLVLVVMLLAGVPWILVRFDDRVALLAIGTLLAGSLGVIALLFGGDRLPVAWRRWRAIEELATLSARARAVLLSAGIGVPVNGLSLAAHIGGAVALWMVARDMELPLGVRDCLVVMPLVMLASALPISVAGWGVREGVLVATLPALGVATEQALVLSLVLGAVALFHGLLGAVPLALGPVRLAAVRQTTLRAHGKDAPTAGRLSEAGIPTAP